MITRSRIVWWAAAPILVAALGSNTPASATQSGPTSLPDSERQPAQAATVLADMAAAEGFSANALTWSSSTVDYNNDGLEDVWVGFHQNIDSRLMRNNGDGTYTWVARDAWKRKNVLGGIPDRHDCAWSDVDGNGLVDAYCSTGRNMSNIVKTAKNDNELWLQTTPGTFVDRGTQWGLGDACGRGRHVAFLDVNRDGWDDLFVGNEKPRDVSGDPCDNPANNLPNEKSKLFLNDAGHGFHYAPAWNVDYLHIGVRCAFPLDYDHDGRMDLFACTWESREPLLLHNTGTGFVERGESQGLTSPVTSARAGDINSDGVADLVMSDPNGFLYRLGVPGGFGAAHRLYTTQNAKFDGWSVAIGDINGDGRNDIYGLVRDVTSKTNPDDVVLLNQGGGAFTTLTPPSTTGNGDKVTAIHPQRGGKAQFLVQNGEGHEPGPVQVIAYR